MPYTLALKSLSTDTLYVLVPKVASGAAALFLQLYIVQHLDPAAYGVFGLCLTCLIFFESFVGSAFDLGLLREAPTLRADGELRVSALERSVIVLKLVVGLCCLVPAVLFGEWLGTHLFHQPNGAQTFIAVVFAGTSTLLLRSVQISFQLSQQFRLFGLIDLLHTFLRIVFVCGLTIVGYASPVALISAYTLAALSVSIGFGFSLYKKMAATPWCTVAECRKILRYGGSVLLVGALSLALSSVDKFALAILSSPVEVGLYQAALTIALLPELVGTCLAQVFSPRITAYCQAGTFSDFFVKLQRSTFIASVMLLLAGIVLTRPIVSFLFPPRYAGAIDLIIILLPAGLAGLIAFPAAVNFLAFFSLRTLLLIDCLMAPFLLLAYYYAAKEGGALAVAWVTVAARCLKALVQHTLTVWLAPRVMTQFAESHGASSRTYALSSGPQPSISTQ